WFVWVPQVCFEHSMECELFHIIVHVYVSLTHISRRDDRECPRESRRCYTVAVLARTSEGTIFHEAPATHDFHHDTFVIRMVFFESSQTPSILVQFPNFQRELPLCELGAGITFCEFGRSDENFI